MKSSLILRNRKKLNNSLKRKIAYGLLTIILISAICYGLNSAFGLFTPFNNWTAKKDIKNGKLQIAEVGEMPLNFDQKQKLAQSYGFRFYLLGCIVPSGIKNGTMLYNKVMIDHLEEKFGKGWWSKFQNQLDSIDHKKSNIIDTTNQYIYDFMKVVIADQKLDLSYGLTIDPEQGCDLSQDDKTFLKSLLIEKSKAKHENEDWRKMTITIHQLPKCLTMADIEDMILQKKKLANFTWDNSRLGFNLSNKNNWYCFSRPLFSIDKKTVVMMIRALCPGLCGTGYTVVFTNKNNNWISKSGGQWIH
jgi:hypothetical protein